MKADDISRGGAATPAFWRFFGHESAGGIVLAIAALAALVISNSAWRPAYETLVQAPGELRLAGWLVLTKPLVVWVNDLWMAVFFLLVGLEIKRELIEGELADRRQALLPAVAALGGMVVPALIYTACNLGDAVALRGWAIPAVSASRRPRKSVSSPRRSARPRPARRRHRVAGRTRSTDSAASTGPLASTSHGNHSPTAGD